jgi:CRP-like cAMP-binding protein
MEVGFGRGTCAESGCISACLKLLSSDQLELIDRKRVEVKFRAGERVSTKGTFASHILYLRKGMVKLFIEEEDRNVILCIEPEGTFLGLQALFGEKPFPYSIETTVDSYFCMFDLYDFQELCRLNPIFASDIIYRLNEFTLRNLERLFTLTQKQLAGRFADILICFHDRIYKSTKFEISLSRKELADITVMSAESLSRVIREFRNDGIVEISGKKVNLLDMERIYQISRTG